MIPETREQPVPYVVAVHGPYEASPVTVSAPTAEAAVALAREYMLLVGGVHSRVEGCALYYGTMRAGWVHGSAVRRPLDAYEVRRRDEAARYGARVWHVADRT